MSRKTVNLIPFAERLFTFPNGDTYNGEFIVDLEKKEIYRHGMGTYFKLNGQFLTGRWDMDCLVGLAKINFRNKCKYEGYLTTVPEFTTGTYTFEDGSEFRGDFNKNLTDGDDDIEFFDPNGKQWDHALDDDTRKISLMYNLLKDDQQALCEQDDESVSTPICLSDDSEIEGC